MLQIPRRVWVGGLGLSGACVVLSVVLWNPVPLVGVFFGLFIASFPLLARLDAVKLDGTRMSVRKAIRWVGPVDLTRLVGFAYRPQSHRRPAVWLLIQREAGPRLRWYWRAGLEHHLRDMLADQRDLRLVEVAAGGSLSEFPGLAEHLAHYVLPSGALVEERAEQALRRYARIESAKRSRSSR